MIRSLRGRVFAASLIASIAAVGIALAIGVFATRSAVRDSYRKEITREANAFSARLGAIADQTNIDATLINAKDLRKTLTIWQIRTGRGSGPVGPGAGGPTFATGATGTARSFINPGPTGGGSGVGGDRNGPSIPLPIATKFAAEILPSDAVKVVRSGHTASGALTIQGRKLLFAAAPVKNHDFFVLATRSDQIETGDFRRYLWGLILAALIAAGLSAAAAALLARRLTKPISEVVAATAALAAGETPERIAEPETEELAELASSFNHMADQLAQAREAERTVLMSASHELRTPLTAISGYAEGIEDGTIDAKTGSKVIVSEASRLERLVQDLLVLARLDQGMFETRAERVDLGKIAETARDRLALRAIDGGIELLVNVHPVAAATADTDRVLQIVTNLVDNAVRVTPRGGNVTIDAGPGKIVVSDTGPGIPAEDLPHVFERFHLRKRRGMGSPDGSGIGLAIADELTEAMGGSVAVESTEGEGARFSVTLPPAVEPDPASD